MLKGSQGLFLRTRNRYCSPAVQQGQRFCVRCAICVRCAKLEIASGAPFEIASDAPFEGTNYGEYNVRLPWLASDAPKKILCDRCAT